MRRFRQCFPAAADRTAIGRGRSVFGGTLRLLS
jgi:hypothetical protein